MATATASKIHLSTRHHPAYAASLREDTAQRASKLLQENHDNHHIFFNDDGFHNHIVHHLLSIYALGADPSAVQRGYDNNTSYQRPPEKLEQKVVKSLQDPVEFKKYLGGKNEKHYHDWLVFFQDEIEAKGWQAAIQEYLLKGDERADDLLARLYAGFLHPIIHLGFGVEFEQPAIIAEALAQAAVHDDWMKPFYLNVEKAAKGSGQSSKSLVSIMEDARANDKLRRSAEFKDSNKIRDGILKRAPDEMIKFASQYVIKPEQLEEKTAEMINFSAYYTGAAQRPDKIPKIDFFYMHDTNCSVFFSSFLKQSWLSTESKVRLLEWKGRTDLVMYFSRGAPELRLNEITEYVPKHPKDDWKELFERISIFPDDGHASKLVRALANGKDACEKYENEDGFILKESSWVKLAHLAVDSVENQNTSWIRGAGFEQAWDGIPDRKQTRL